MESVTVESNRRFCSVAPLLALLLFLSACSSHSPQNSIVAARGLQAPVSALAMSQQQRSCYQLYLGIVQQAETQQKVDPVYQKLEGLPFLRSDRLLASYAEQFENQNQNQNQYQDWLARLNNNARESAVIEWQRLGNPQLGTQSTGNINSQADLENALQQCSEPLLRLLLKHWPSNSSQAQQYLIKPAGQSPNLYRFWSGFLGRLMAPSLRRTIKHEHQILHKLQAEAELPGRDELFKNHQVYRSGFEPEAAIELSAEVRPPAVVNVSVIPLDALGLPLIPEETSKSLLDQYAPYWAIAAQGSNDIPGEPVLGNDSVQLNTANHHQYQYLSLGRWQGEAVVQLNYVIWFSERRSTKLLDLVSGRLDGVQWRVQLNLAGQVLAYDAIHNCGCWYQLYLNPRLAKAKVQDNNVEPVFISQYWPGQQPPILLLEANTHQLIKPVSLESLGVIPNELTAEAMTILTKRPYSDLRASELFDGDGIIPQSKRVERFLLWPSGVPSPGAMRLRNKHIIAFIGERYFDQPWLLQTLAEPQLSD